MKKSDAIAFFGNQQKTAAAVRVTRGAVSKWPDELPPTISDRVIAAAVRMGVAVPDEWISAPSSDQVAA